MSASPMESTVTIIRWGATTHSPQPVSPAQLSNIDDPVNDTGTGPARGDLDFSSEFELLLEAI